MLPPLFFASYQAQEDTPGSNTCCKSTIHPSPRKKKKNHEGRRGFVGALLSSPPTPPPHHRCYWRASVISHVPTQHFLTKCSPHHPQKTRAASRPCPTPRTLGEDGDAPHLSCPRQQTPATSCPVLGLCLVQPTGFYLILIPDVQLATGETGHHVGQQRYTQG